jgi:hypothetical protein
LRSSLYLKSASVHSSVTVNPYQYSSTSVENLKQEIVNKLRLKMPRTKKKRAD